MKGLVDKSRGIVTLMTEVLTKIKTTDPLRLVKQVQEQVVHRKRNRSDSSDNSPVKELVSR